MFEIDELGKAIKGKERQVIVISLLFLISTSFMISVGYWNLKMNELMTGFLDCSSSHAFPSPPNCASPALLERYQDLESRSQFSLFMGIVTFFGTALALHMQTRSRIESLEVVATTTK